LTVPASCNQQDTYSVMREHNKQVTNPWIGRNLYGMFRETGLDNIQMLPFVSRKMDDTFADCDAIFRLSDSAKACLGEARAKTWIKETTEMGNRHCLWVGLNLYTVVGTKATSPNN